MNIPPELCTRCKGYKKLCGLSRCPILESFQAQVRTYMRLSGLTAQGSTPPSVLVGEAGYPNVTLHFMIPVGVYGEEARAFEDPVGWSRSRVGIDHIIRYRSELLSGQLKVRVDRPEVLYEKELGLVAISEKPVDSELRLTKAPIPALRFDGITKPIGPRAPAEEIRVTGNPSVPRAIERAFFEELKAEEGARELYFRGVDVYPIQRLLSLGFMGKRGRRKVVPTRWAITAVDDIVSRGVRERLRGAQEGSSFEVYYGEYLGDKFLIFFKPGPGRFEWIEVWQPRSFWATSSPKPVLWKVEENSLGEATASDGGFSAARLAILEFMLRRGRRWDVAILREITPGYYAPVGSWHIRETVRRTLESPPVLREPTREEIRQEAESRMSPEALKHLGELKLLKRQIKLTDFM
ncbi:MAG: Nre family DNA repair protein [Acidilobaceae archaeon]